MSESFQRPEIKSVDFCVDENIWGHRLYDEQLPHLTVLEFLGVLGSNLDRPLHPHDGLHGTVRFQPQRQIRARTPTKRNGVSGLSGSTRGRPATVMRTWRTSVTRSRVSMTLRGPWSFFDRRLLNREATSGGAQSLSSRLVRMHFMRTWRSIPVET